MIALHRRFTWLVCWTAVAAATMAEDIKHPPATIDFVRDVVPILAKNCTACHNDKKQEGGLNLADYDQLLRGGDSGPAIVPRGVEESYLLERVASMDEPMPPEDNSVGAKRLEENELDLLKRWIAEGATAATSRADRPVIEFQSMPSNLHPIYALAAGSATSALAVGRGNQAFVVDDPAAEPIPLRDAALDRSQAPETWSSHLDFVQSIAFSPDGNRIATGGYKTLKIWRRQLEPELQLAGLASDATLIRYSDDGKRLAVISQQSIVDVINVATGEMHRFLSGHTAANDHGAVGDYAVTALAWLGDDRSLVTCDAEGRMLLIDAETFELQSLEPLQSPLALAHLTNVGDGRLMGATGEGTICELQLQSEANARPHAFRLQKIVEAGPISAWVGMRTSAELLIASPEGAVSRVAVPAGTITPCFSAEAPVEEMVASNDDQLLATLSTNATPALWRMSDHTRIAQLDGDYALTQQLAKQQRDVGRQQQQLQGLSAQLPELEAEQKKEAEARDKVAESRDKAAQELSARTEEVGKSQSQLSQTEQTLAEAQAAIEQARQRAEALVAEVEAQKKALAEAQQKQRDAEAELAKRNQALAAADDSAQRAAEAIPQLNTRLEAQQQRLQTLQQDLDQLQAARHDLQPVRSLCFSPDGKHVVFSRTAGQPQIASTLDGRPLAALQGAPDALVRMTLSDAGQIMGYAPQGRLLGWNARLPWTLERTLGAPDAETFSDRITALDFSPDGRWLAVGGGPPSRHGELKLVEVTSGEVSPDLGQVHSDTVLALRFSPDGSHLASAGADKICRLLDLNDRTWLRSLEGHTHHILSVDWRDDGQVLATAGADGDIKLWTPQSGQQLRTIGGAGKEVTAVRFVGQTSQLLSASIDGTVRLHNADDGKQLRDFNGANGPVFALAIADAYTQAVAGGDDGILRSWQLSDAKPLWTVPAQPSQP